MYMVASFVSFIIKHKEQEIVGYRVDGSRIKLYFKGCVREAYILDNMDNIDNTVYIKYDNIIFRGLRNWASGDWVSLCRAYA